MNQALRGDLAGKVAIVTGSTQGVGEAIARRFVAWGGIGVVVTGRDRPRGEAVARSLEDSGGRAVFVPADAADPDAAALAEWIERHVAFPGTMVDRIVPATSQADRDRVARTVGIDDHGLVVGEAFRQWVIEDRFAGDRPPWELAGAELVADVRPFEAMKMRLLNGCQSALAYLGSLAGCEHTSDAMAVPALAGYAQALMRRESAPTLAMPAGVDVDGYQVQVLRRLRNGAVAHRTWQIATDGSQKIPQRLLEPLRWHLARGRDAPLLAVAVAGWILPFTPEGHIR